MRLERVHLNHGRVPRLSHPHFSVVFAIACAVVVEEAKLFSRPGGHNFDITSAVYFFKPPSETKS